MSTFQDKLLALLRAQDKLKRYNKQYYGTGVDDPLTLEEVIEAREEENNCKIYCLKEVIKDFVWTAVAPKPGHCYVEFLKITAVCDKVKSRLSLIPEHNLLTRFKGEYNYFEFYDDKTLTIRFNTFDDMLDFIQETKINVDLSHVRDYVDHVQSRLNKWNKGILEWKD